MDLDKLIHELTRIPLDEMRKKTGDYCELVVALEDLTPVEDILDKYFGPAKKLEGKSPDRESTYLAQDFGGVRKNQILYYKEEDKTAVCALIWPWGDGVLATVKVARYPKKPPLPPEESLWSKVVHTFSGHS